MPFGPFKDFDDCKKSQIKDGKPEDVANDICGEMQKKLKTFESSFQYAASIEPLKGETGRKAKIFLINEEVNENDWGVTKQSLKDGVKTIIGKPLLGPPNLGHEATLTVGDFISAQFEGNTAYGIANITNNNAWENIKKGEWRYVSPEVVASCGVKTNKAGENILPCFEFRHVAFVNEPAYGTQEAKVMDSYIGAKSFAAGLKKILVNKEVNKNNNENSMNDCEKITKELTDKFTGELKSKNEQITKLQAEIKKTQTKTQEIPETVLNQLKTLEAFKANVEKEKITTLRNEVIALRGGIKELSETERTDISKYDADTLTAVKSALTVAKSTLDLRPETTGPKVPIYGAGKDDKVTFRTLKRITGIGGVYQ
tara:strand:- start:1380 stop:2489 length:1110 start_codon:yes stop_codon:yes gene_type:complete